MKIDQNTVYHYGRLFDRFAVRLFEMVRAISATEAKVNFGAITRHVIDTGDPVIVKSNGRPTVAIVPVDQLARLRELEEQERRKIALEHLQHLRERVRAKNQDLSMEQADAIAGDIVDTAVNALFEKGIVRYTE